MSKDWTPTTVVRHMQKRCHVTMTEEAGALVVALTGAADVAAAAALHEDLLAIPFDREVVVSIAGLERLDGAGLQLIMAMHEAAKKAGFTMKVEGEGEAMRVMERAGASFLWKREEV